LTGAENMQELTKLEKEILAFKSSLRRQEMIAGERYYEGYHEIMRRERTMIGKDGAVIPLKNLPNNKIIDNQYAKAVDQKTNYILGKPLTFNSKDETYLNNIKSIFNKRFHKTMRNICKNSFNCGIAYLYVYYENDTLKFKRFKGSEIIPHWRDSEHTELESFIRIYTTIVIESGMEKTLEKAEYYTKEGVRTYVVNSDKLIFEADHQYNLITEYEMDNEIPVSEMAMTWDRIPLIPFKYNDNELPLIRRVKTLQDGINAILSDFTNNMQEDSRNTILVIKNYDGQDLGEFRHNLANFGAVKVRSTENGDGGIDTLTIEVNSENYKVILDIFKKALIENARSFDAKDDRMGGNPNQMNIQSMYSDIDLDANEIETEFQAAFEDLLWFVNQYLAYKKLPVLSENETLEVIFNRDILVNEAQTIENIKNSVGIISNKTLVANHPLVTDVKEELEQIKAEQAEEQAQFADYNNAFNKNVGVGNEE